MQDNIIKFPAPADPNIEQVLGRFLDDCRKRLKAKTMRRYESVIDLFKSSMNNYAHQSLSDAERVLFDRFYDAEGDAHREFCQVFGSEKIPENVGEFLNYFMVRKVMCGKGLMKAACTVIKKLGKWLNEQDYISDELAEDMADRAGDAATDH